MHEPDVRVRVIRFGSFELDPRSGELRNGTRRLRVPDQSIEILKALLEHPGELVTRDQLRQRLWPSDIFVDFEHGLNAAMRRLREAIGDSAEAPTSSRPCPAAATDSLPLPNASAHLSTLRQRLMFRRYR
jgi:DNA-binding winged helix-turn-helix (wHTH) protein